MNLGFPIGTKVKIHTITGGCYDGITGRVTSSLAPFDTLFNPRPPLEGENVYSWFQRVEFDTPVHCGERFIERDIFYLREMEEI